MNNHCVFGSPWSYRVEREQDRTFQSLEIKRFLQVRPEEEEEECVRTQIKGHWSAAWRSREQDRLGNGAQDKRRIFIHSREIYLHLCWPV